MPGGAVLTSRALRRPGPYGVLAVALCLAHALVPVVAVDAVVLVAAALLGAGAVAVGVRRHRPRCRLGWWLVGAGVLSWGLGDAVYHVYAEVLGLDPYPSPADGAYVAAYPLVATGLALHLRGRARGVERGALLDIAVVVGGAWLLAWVAVVEPVAAAQSGRSLVAMVNLAYPLGSALLLGLLVPLLALPGGRTPSTDRLALGLGAMLAADVAYAFLSSTTAVVEGPVNLAYMAAYLLVGAAALQPTMRDAALPAPTCGRVAPLTRRRTAALAAAALTAPGVLAVQLLLGAPVSGWPLVVASVVMLLLVVARMHAAVRDVARAAGERTSLQARVAHEAAHDGLTGLANRARVLAVLEVALHAEARARRGDARAVGLLLVDLDRFTQVNDRWGHAVGDVVLRGVATRLRGLSRADDLVGRLGADQFVVVLGRRTQEELRETADLVVVALGAPLGTAGAEVSVGASAGGALAVPGRVSLPALLADAEAALQRAKRGGRGRAVVADEEQRRDADARARLEGALRSGLAAGELVLRYQPVHLLSTGAVTGYEALVRWERPGHGLVPPDQFIPVAERSDLVCDLDRWVLGEATRQMAAWTAADPVRFAGRSVAVNVSGRHLARSAVVGHVAEALERSGLAAQQLVVEITETVLVDASTAREHLAALRDLGVGVSIDDFGTGYTSVAQLRHLPADTLKVDRAFVASDDPGSRDLLALMVHAGHAAGLRVVAEGVEEVEQVVHLRAAGCDMAQGYLLARPQAAQDVPTHGVVLPAALVPSQDARRDGVPGAALRA